MCARARMRVRVREHERERERVVCLHLCLFVRVCLCAHKRPLRVEGWGRVLRVNTHAYKHKQQYIHTVHSFVLYGRICTSLHTNKFTRTYVCICTHIFNMPPIYMCMCMCVWIYTLDPRPYTPNLFKRDQIRESKTHALSLNNHPPICKQHHSNARNILPLC